MRIATLLLVLVGSMASVVSAQRPAPREMGLVPGDSFTARVRYSNSWGESTVIVQPASGPASPRTPSAPVPAGGSLPAAGQAAAASAASSGGTVRLVPRIEAVPLGNDPLFVDLKLEVKVLEEGRYSLKPVVDSVHYFDDRGRRWTIQLKEPLAREKALKLVKELSIALKGTTPSGLEAQMIEEQLVGASIVLLNGSTLEALAPGWRSEPQLPGIEEVLRDSLPEELRKSVRDTVTRFFLDAASRAVPRAPAGIQAGAKHEVGGVSFTAEKIRHPKGGSQALLVGASSDPGVGTLVKERFWADRVTGLPVEGSSLRLRENLTGNNHRYDAVKWETKIELFTPAPRK